MSTCSSVDRSGVGGSVQSKPGVSIVVVPLTAGSLQSYVKKCKQNAAIQIQ